MPRKPAPLPVPPRAAAAIIIAAAALVAFITLALGDLFTASPTSDETAHLVAGHSYLVAHDYRLNPEHPPLVKMFAALPLAGMRVWPAGFRDAADGTRAFAYFREAWATAIANPSFSEWRVAQLLLYGMRDRVGADPLDAPTTAVYARGDFLNDAQAMFRRARLMMLLLGVALASVIFCWSYELWGMWGAAFSLLLFCFDPNFIAHSTLVTTDVPAALAYAATLYALWRFARRMTIARGAVFAVCFGVAQTVKFSAVLLAPIVVITAIVVVLRDRTRVVPMLAALAAAALAAVIAIWSVYGFRHSTAPDPQAARAEEIAARGTLRQRVLDAPDVWPSGHLDVPRAVARWAAMERLAKVMPDTAGEQDLRAAMRFTRPGLTGQLILFADAHHLLPEAYLYGFASTVSSSLLRSSYLDGRYANTGFPDYFFWTTMWKTPLPILAALIVGLPLAWRRRGAGLGLLAIPVVIYGGYAVAGNIHIGHRHLFPIFPFLYALCGAAGVWWSELRRRRAVAGAIAVAWLAIGAVVVLLPRPASVINQHLAYLNEFAGGPRAGAMKLSDSNFDWGQDLARLGKWYAASGIKEPIDLVYFGNADPRSYGIRYNNLRTPDFPEPRGPWFAISQVDFAGIQFDPQHRSAYWQTMLARHGAQRVDTPGYSIFVFHFGERFSKNAAIPSAASSEANARN
jgi:4-amino-4-deoxy-L-arabinose transferase-like glycosyltransferase